ncbi:unnamed protein product [Danaus chrysippus]|uniref:(African queen) hypothetical protein n=1 Tax=Danaus chrysippus TaxID=151541 RepID=A0A8J2VTT6_9NEOP|nr:unnamed protein product [Danaus chrysippus]
MIILLPTFAISLAARVPAGTELVCCKNSSAEWNKIPISPIEDDRSAPLLQYAEWSPVGSGLVFVYDNDIYYKPKVLKALVCRITSNG